MTFRISRRVLGGSAAALALGLALAAASAGTAEARWRRGPAFFAGAVTGLAAGAIIAGATRPAYGYGYRPAPVYGYGPSYYAPHCYWARQRVYHDPWTYTVQRVRVCS
jgi:hypothetical protein